MAINEQSTDVKIAAVKGVNTSNVRDVVGGEGVLGISNAGCGVRGSSTSGRGVVAQSDTDYALRAHSRTLSGVRASSDTGVGVEGESRAAAPGVVGSSVSGNGVEGRASAGIGVVGQSKEGRGVLGESGNAQGVWGVSHAKFHGGVIGVNDNLSQEAGPGVFGTSRGTGILGESETWHGVFGTTKSTTGGAGVEGNHKNGGTGVAGVSDRGFGVFGISKSGHAGFFDGKVWISGELGVGGDITLPNADCAEDFDIADAASIEPGTVMVLGDDESLHQSSQSYDKRVAGVVSGAGKYKPGIVLDKQEPNANRKPIALLGKVYCKVDARYASIEVGDLLTTSPSPGHAMKASDHLQAFGAVIGKALRPLKEGQGLIPILIALQ